MKRWNGWGDEAINYPLPESAGLYLADQVGVGLALEDADFLQVLGSLEKSRLQPHGLISTGSEDRLRHARGQSLPDWVALRSGQMNAFPDGVAYPRSDEDVRALLAFARQGEVKVIPYGGGTSVVGHINPLMDNGPILTMDMSHLNRMLALDDTSQLATFEAGIVGPEVERQLNPHGYTLGHFPQSFELSTLGGWIATRSSGQQSYHYGRIENLFAGGHVVTPIGELDLPIQPASAAGPDLKQIVLGSEGRLGVITRATVRIHRLPEMEAFYGVFFRDWERGVRAVREIVQCGIAVSMLRLSNAMETSTTLALSGKDGAGAVGRPGAAGIGLRGGTVPAGLRGHRQPPASEESPPGNPGDHTVARRVDDRHCHRQNVAEIPFLCALSAEYIVGTRLRPGYPRDGRPVGQRGGDRSGDPKGHPGGVGRGG